MTSWLNRFKNLFKSQKEPQSQPDRSQQIQKFIQIIEEDDANSIEEARDWVQSEDIEPLIALYWQLENWQKKRALVDIMQDQYHPDMQKMMLDFLRAPMAEGDEWVELAKAVALGFMDERYDRFMHYYNDRKSLARDVNTVLRKHGMKADPVPKKETPPPKPKPPETNATKSPNQRLMDGAMAGELTAVKTALQDGASINVGIGGGIYDGCTALIMALMREHFVVAEYLIDQEADVNCKRPSPHKPDPTRGQTPLWWASNHGHLSLAKKLLANDADVNTADHHGGTPLTVASSSGHLDMVKYLVESGANVHAQIYDGRKAFNLAITNGKKRVAEYLLTVGNNPNEGGSSGYTPLMIAAENNFMDLAKLLIKQGADVNAPHAGAGIYVAMRGWTPLVFAVRAGYVRMTKLLIQSGADVNYAVPAGNNYDGEQLPERRVIEFASGKRAESVRKVLKDAGAN